MRLSILTIEKSYSIRLLHLYFWTTIKNEGSYNKTATSLFLVVAVAVAFAVAVAVAVDRSTILLLLLFEFGT